jgi:hypothetical protein
VLWAGDEPGFVGEDDGLQPVAQAEFHQQAGDVRFDGCLGYEEAGGYFRVGHTAGDLTQDVHLTAGQRVQLGCGRGRDRAGAAWSR